MAQPPDPHDSPAPPEPPPPRGPAPAPLWPAGWSWTRRHLIALAAMLAALGAMIAWRTVQNRALLGPDLEVVGADLAPAGEKIDPNTATWASLARLPGVGESKARAIVTYRTRFAAARTDRPAFLCADDLQNVDGIGPTIVRQSAAWLVFPPAPPP